MDNFIRVYQNAFSNELCDRLISKFESTELEERERHDFGEMHFSQVNFRACGWKQEQEELVHLRQRRAISAGDTADLAIGER